MRKTIALASLATLTSLAAGPALAHAGHAPTTGFAAGFAHPFTGLDHLLAMLALGLWAGLAGGRALIAWPAAFMAFMSAGFGLGADAGATAWTQPAILASVLALGLAATANLKLATTAGAAVAGAFALAHGFAHGQELPAAAAATTFAAGFTLATALLLATGAACVYAARGVRAPALARLAGAGVAVAGAALILPG